MDDDVEVENCGTLFRFRLMTDRALDWVYENVATEDHNWIGWRTLAVEHRFAKQISDGMQAAGLEVS